MRVSIFFSRSWMFLQNSYEKKAPFPGGKKIWNNPRKIQRDWCKDLKQITEDIIWDWAKEILTCRRHRKTPIEINRFKGESGPCRQTWAFLWRRQVAFPYNYLNIVRSGRAWNHDGGTQEQVQPPGTLPGGDAPLPPTTEHPVHHCRRQPDR